MFGSVGYFPRTIKSTGAKKSKFSDQSHTGIALGCSDYTNGMMFWDLTTSRSFSVSPDYSLDPTKSLANPFPELHYEVASKSKAAARMHSATPSFPTTRSSLFALHLAAQSANLVTTGFFKRPSTAFVEAPNTGTRPWLPHSSRLVSPHANMTPASSLVPLLTESPHCT
jgi:hypothetical protein